MSPQNKELDDRGAATDFGIVTAESAPVSPSVQVGILRGKVVSQRRGTVQFYEDAKRGHRMSMRAMRKFIARSLKEYGSSALKDPTFRWCVQEVGKYAHSQAPREIKAETKLLIEFDMGG